eukprot:10038791-Heterocapsa_arctica.AAC.1
MLKNTLPLLLRSNAAWWADESLLLPEASMDCIRVVLLAFAEARNSSIEVFASISCGSKNGDSRARPTIGRP